MKYLVLLLDNISNPDGTCQIVDYHGYKVGKYLNNGNPVIPYMSII